MAGMSGGLGTSLIKYVVTALVVMNYSTVFTAVNQGFVNAGSWISNASGAGNLFENWANDIQTQFSQDGAQQMWGLITGSMAGLIDAILILVAYILYPVVVAIFGFFYIFYGSVLYIFGPIVIALMPLGATNRLAKAYVENVMIWNAWPILYGGFGALLSAVSDGTGRPDAEPEQFPWRPGQPRRLFSNRRCEHHLFLGNCGYPFHR